MASYQPIFTEAQEAKFLHLLEAMHNVFRPELPDTKLTPTALRLLGDARAACPCGERVMREALEMEIAPIDFGWHASYFETVDAPHFTSDLLEWAQTPCGLQSVSEYWGQLAHTVNSLSDFLTECWHMTHSNIQLEIYRAILTELGIDATP